MTDMNTTNIANALGARASGAPSAGTSFAGADSAFRTAFLNAAERNQSAMAGGVSGSTVSTPSSAEQEFMDYASMSLEEKMFYAALASLGISKKEYDAMSADERLAIAAKLSLAMQQLTKADNTEKVL
ncbi:hypothetical protein QWC_23160 [Achromobacter marplatensis]|jgi:hypothetical protein|nr:hypothetical protein QWC_23160 [Achromobacter marplatensis]